MAVAFCPRRYRRADPALVAQWIEQRTSNPKVAGSNPAGRTTVNRPSCPSWTMTDISRLPDRNRPCAILTQPVHALQILAGLATALIAIGMALFIAARRRRREFTA